MSCGTLSSYPVPAEHSNITAPRREGPGSSGRVPRPFRRSLSLLALCALASASALAQPVEWIQRPVSGPSARFNPAMAYDSTRHVSVLFGGYAGACLGDTWEWNGAAWARRATTGPSPRYYPAMAHDTARGVTVLFGGQTATGLSDETWEWNGAVWTRRPVSGPAPRYFHAMAYDAARAVTVLFGGYSDGYDADTWEWNGTTWTQRMVSGPSPRIGHAVAYDAARGVTVLFGGDAAGDTWEWNGATWAKPIVSGPSPRFSPGMTYDAARALTVLFGGYTNTFNGETWEWNGASWTRRMVIGPVPRFYPAMVYDTARDVSVLFGGIPYGGVNGETWELREPCDEPSISGQPTMQVTCPNGPALFSVIASSPDAPTYQWEARPNGGSDFVALVNGDNPGIGEVTDAHEARVHVVHAHGTGGSFRCVITNGCGSVTSDPALLNVCIGDFNCDGGIDGADVEFFFELWEAGNAPADVNDDGGIDGADVEFFFGRWEGGC